MGWKPCAPLLAVLALAAEAGGSPGGADPSPAVYVRGRKGLADLLGWTARDCARAAKEGTAGTGPGTLLLLLDTTPRLGALLGSPAEAVETLHGLAPRGLGIGVLDFDGNRTALPAEPGAVEAAVARAVSSGKGGYANAWSRVRSAISLLAPCPSPRTLFVLTEWNADRDEGVEETVAAARAAGVRVVVAAPEALHSLPWRAYLNAGIPRVRPAPKWGGTPSCESPFPEVPLLTDANLAGVFLWEPAFEPDMEDLPAGVPPDLPPEIADLVRERREARSIHADWPTPPDFDTGIPPIPSGFGYWGLSRLARETGGRYLVTGFRPSLCPFRVDYDPRALHDVAPDLRSRGAAAAEPPEGMGQLLRAWRALDRAAVAVEGPPLPGPSPGGRRHAPLGRHYVSVAALRREADDAADREAALAILAGGLDSLRAAWSAPGSRVPPRVRGDLDVLRVSVARARFHLVELAAVLRAGTEEDLGPHRSATVLVRRICRFWEGAAAARDEARDRLPPEGPRRERFEAAFAATADAMERHPADPFGAVARSGALWSWGIVPLHPGRVPDPPTAPENPDTGKAPKEGGTPTPPPSGPGSGGGGTGTPK
jgi:hypothetical protein